MAEDVLTHVVRHIRRLAGWRSGIGVTDQHLLKRYLAERDHVAIETLVARHAPLVLGVCRKVLRDSHDAEDAFQATFLVLFRKAESIRRHDALGPWLYGVAYRVAARVRSNRQKQRSRERGIEEETLVSEEGGELVEEISPLIHEEINRLPDKYRKPIVLCYLQGKKRDEAAQLLGWSRGAVKGRLERARDLLRGRLLKRGVEISAVALTAALSQTSASAASAELIGQVAEAAISLAQKGTVAGMVSRTVGSLAEGVLRSMLVTKIRLAVIMILSLAALTAAGTAVGLRVSADQPQVPKTERRERRTEESAKPTSTKESDDHDHFLDVACLRDGIVQSLGGPASEGKRDLRGLRKGDRIEEGQVLATLDHQLAVNEMQIKEAKVLAARADLEAARKTADEANARYETQAKLQKKSLTSEDDVRSAKLTADRYQQEVISKEAALRVAELEVQQAKTVLGMYTIRSRTSGVISKIYKRPGEAVKAFEPIVQIRVEE
jgi:RNA polymerase sigma factor (sigma-70 family)